MSDRNRMIFSLISGIIVIGVSIFIAYISFDILESSAEASLQNWKFGGAFAAFVFTASLLTSIIFQFYKQMTGDRIAIYSQQIQELQTKLIKGAPCPPEYTIDIDEKHKLVFARPNEWLPREGILYQYVNKNPSDVLEANFNVVYQGKEDLSELYEKSNIGKFDAANVDVNKLYDFVLTLVVTGIKSFTLNYENGALSNEYVFVDGNKSLKYIHTYTAQLPNSENKTRMCQSGILTYIPRLKAFYQFTFTDNEEDYLKSSEIFNIVVSSIRFL